MDTERRISMDAELKQSPPVYDDLESARLILEEAICMLAEFKIHLNGENCGSERKAQRPGLTGLASEIRCLAHGIRGEVRDLQTSIFGTKTGSGELKVSNRVDTRPTVRGGGFPHEHA